MTGRMSRWYNEYEQELERQAAHHAGVRDGLREAAAICRERAEVWHDADHKVRRDEARDCADAIERAANEPPAEAVIA